MRFVRAAKIKADTVHIISKRRLREFWTMHPDAESSLRHWYSVAHQALWTNFNQVRSDMSHADQVRVKSGSIVTIFNVGGNKYRLVTAIHYNRGVVFTLKILTHAQYDRSQWKDEL